MDEDSFCAYGRYEQEIIAANTEHKRSTKGTVDFPLRAVELYLLFVYFCVVTGTEWADEAVSCCLFGGCNN